MEVGTRISEIALGLKGQQSLSVHGESIRYDCGGFVLATYALADVPLSGNTRSISNLRQNVGCWSIHRLWGMWSSLIPMIETKISDWMMC